MHFSFYKCVHIDKDLLSKEMSHIQFCFIKNISCFKIRLALKSFLTGAYLINEYTAQFHLKG